MTNMLTTESGGGQTIDSSMHGNIYFFPNSLSIQRILMVCAALLCALCWMEGDRSGTTATWQATKLVAAALLPHFQL